MITAKEKIKQCSNSMFVKEESELVDRLVYAFHEYTKEAIKADRINLLEHVKCYINPNGANISSSLTINIDKDSIINAPNIELK